MSLCGPHLSKWALKTVTFPDLNDELTWANKVGFEHQPGLKKFSPFPSPPKKSTTPSSFHIYSEVLIEQVKQSHGQSMFFQKKQRPPRLAIWVAQSPPCFSPTVFDAGRVALRIPMPLRLAVPAEPQAAKRLKTDQKSVPLARLLFFSAGFFGSSKWKKYNTWKISISYHKTDIEDSEVFRKRHDVWLWCQWIVEGIWSTHWGSHSQFDLCIILQKIEVVTTN